MKVKNILLINTSFLTIKREFRFPLSLSALENYLMSKWENNFNIKAIDLGTKSFDELKQNLKIKQYDMICLSVPSTHLAESALKISSWVKTKLPNVFLVVGGVHPSLSPEEFLSLADAVIIGEGEYPLHNLITALNVNGDASKVKGVCTLSTNGEIKYTPQTMFVDLEKVPYFKVPNGLNLEDYTNSELARYFNGEPWLPYQSTRGCNFSCPFCSHPKLFGNTIRSKSALKLAKDIFHIASNYNVFNFNFYDENFTLNKPRLHDICTNLSQIKYELKCDLKWKCMTRGDIDREDVWFDMANAGCRHVSFGIESVDKSVNKIINKSLNVNAIRKNLIAAKKNKISTRIFLMVGLPCQDWKSIDKTAKFVEDHAKYIDEIEVSIYVPYPGTLIYSSPKEYGIDISNLDYKTCLPRSEFYTSHGSNAGISTRWMSRKDIIEARDFIEKKFNEKIRRNQDQLYSK